MAELTITLVYEGNKMHVGEIDQDDELEICMECVGNDGFLMYICREQAEVLRDHLNRVLKRVI